MAFEDVYSNCVRSTIIIDALEYKLSNITTENNANKITLEAQGVELSDLKQKCSYLQESLVKRNEENV